MKKYFGDWKFYKKLLWLAIPIMVQNAITNFVGFLDNIMVGQLGTEQMSGVAIVNQFVFVFNLCVFGGLSGAGIFGAQFFGCKDFKGVRDTFRFKVITGMVIAVLTFIVFIGFGQNLIQMFLTASSAEDSAATFRHGMAYLGVILFEIVPFIVVQIYASTLRETGETVVPMAAGIAAVIVNLVLNYILIFGNFGAPRMGVAGAAVATVVSRVIECAIVVCWTHFQSGKNLFIIGAYRSLKVPMTLTRKILVKGTPLMLNEILWAGGMAMINQCFSVRGLSVVAALNITSTIANLFNIVFIAMGSCVAILVGQNLGANEFEEAKETAAKVITFSVLATVGTSIILFLASGLFPRLYNTSQQIRLIAGEMIQINALVMPLQAFLHATYFTIRSGGRTWITFLFDSAYTWCVAIPFAFCIVHFTSFDIIIIYLMYCSLDIIKATVGFILLKRGIWVRNIVEESV
ncbi:MAG: MATE family efflux transporter [Lachnospiraceae bacterium]|jgi:putative efflux protein, MATE family|nr:MATE family efflux transporter [Lachnospiraceae bacterium]RKI29772.1 MATE family efflux transporter [bacterium D16-36]RKI71633.1 MATE family efflux transporter [bacterium 1xD8-6]